MRILFEKLLLILLQCFPNVSNMQTADSVREGHVCRKIAETTSEPGCDEQNHGVPTHVPASREDDYLKLVLVMQAGW